VNTVIVRSGFLLSIFFCIQLFSQSFSFSEQIINKNSFAEDVKIELAVDSELVGYLGYTRLPLSYYIIHSFYIYPQFRAQGYGKKLLVYGCDVLKNCKPRKIFIQPGPFELVDGQMIDINGEEEQIALAKLVRLYGSVGFEPVSTWTVGVAFMLYKVLWIDEYAEYLMSMTL
jgi:GNAT superfamily N-acetyltransferase